MSKTIVLRQCHTGVLRKYTKFKKKSIKFGKKHVVIFIGINEYIKTPHIPFIFLSKE